MFKILIYDKIASSQESQTLNDPKQTTAVYNLLYAQHLLQIQHERFRYRIFNIITRASCFQISLHLKKKMLFDISVFNIVLD